MVAPSSTLYHSSTTLSGKKMSMMDLDNHGVIVFTVTSTIAVSSPYGFVVSVMSGVPYRRCKCLFNEMAHTTTCITLDPLLQLYIFIYIYVLYTSLYTSWLHLEQSHEVQHLGRQKTLFQRKHDCHTHSFATQKLICTTFNRVNGSATSTVIGKCGWIPLSYFC